MQIERVALRETRSLRTLFTQAPNVCFKSVYSSVVLEGQAGVTGGRPAAEELISVQVCRQSTGSHQHASFLPTLP